MRPTHLISARSVVPKELTPLERLSCNLAWSWDEQAWRLFERLDSGLWEQTNHNPRALLRLVNQRRLEEAARDSGFCEELRDVADRLLALAPGNGPVVCYFSAEFGLTESLPTYAG